MAYRIIYVVPQSGLEIECTVTSLYPPRKDDHDDSLYHVSALADSINHNERNLTIKRELIRKVEEIPNPPLPENNTPRITEVAVVRREQAVDTHARIVEPPASAEEELADPVALRRNEGEPQLFSYAGEIFGIYSENSEGLVDRTVDQMFGSGDLMVGHYGTEPASVLLATSPDWDGGETEKEPDLLSQADPPSPPTRRIILRKRGE